jgi:hypothetical protein
VRNNIKKALVILSVLGVIANDIKRQLTAHKFVFEINDPSNTKHKKEH